MILLPIDAVAYIRRTFYQNFRQKGSVALIIQFERHGRIAVIRLNGPERRNAIDPAAAGELHDAFLKFDGDDELAAAVLVGQGGTFCSGADRNALSRGEAWNAGPDGRGSMGPTRLRLSKPVIAAIEGFAIGGGFELALWCDLRVASETAVFALGSRRLGIPCLDGGTYRLPRIIGASRAMDIILTGREVRAEEAYAIGLVHRLVPPGETLDFAMAWAEELLQHPQGALSTDRACLIDSGAMSQTQALVHEARLGMALISEMSPEASATPRRSAS